jgi:REP element-mobilizing transposase RayT
MEHKGWRSRGYLPHYDRAEEVQHVVFGLADAFPQERDAPVNVVERWLWREAALDRGAGACLLRGDAATIVEDALLYFDSQRYGLFAWCVMPNHVHALVCVMQGWPLGPVVHSWKSFTANRINAIYSRTGALWRREYYDRFMRDDAEFDATRRYIEENPVKAKFVEMAEDWRWSSAWRGRVAKP